MSKDASRQKHAPTEADRQAVIRAVNDRMNELRINPRDINELTGQSETTIYAVLNGTGSPTRSTLSLLSAGLGWRINHLDNILHGRSQENAAPLSTMEQDLAQLIRKMADFDTLRDDVSELKDIVHRIDGKIDVVIHGRPASADGHGGSD